MSRWGFLNDPAWIAAMAAVLLCMITAFIIGAQVVVMIWQTNNADRHETRQLLLLKLQHEHEWMFRLNAERQSILKLGRAVHLDAGVLQRRRSDREIWSDLWQRVSELNDLLNTTDAAAFTSAYDEWYPGLTAYVDALLKAVVNDSVMNEQLGVQDDIPNPVTVTAFAAAETEYKPIVLFLQIETAIRMAFFDFKNDWDAQFERPRQNRFGIIWARLRGRMAGR